jgi:hypothetical protein
MTPARSRKFLRGSLLVVTLLGTAALWSGCGSDGVGTIHIDPPKARTDLMRTGAGVAPVAIARPSESGTPRTAVPRSATKNHVPKNR